MKIPRDQKLIDIGCDVVVRFYEHDQYGNPVVAIKTLKKRAPGYSDNFYKKFFDFLIRLLKATISVVGRAPLKKKSGRKYADYSDIDQDYVLSQLKKEFPNQPKSIILTFLGWVIFWHYLK